MAWPPHSGVPFVVSNVGGGGGRDIGLDLTRNGGFDTDTLWSKGAGWTIAGGVAVATASSAALTQVHQLAISTRYIVTYTVTAYTGGTVTVSLGPTSGTARSATGTYIEIITAGGQNVAFTAAAATLEIDNVSVRAA